MKKKIKTQKDDLNENIHEGRKNKNQGLKIKTKTKKKPK